MSYECCGEGGLTIVRNISLEGRIQLSHYAELDDLDGPVPPNA
jgi:hypothetical protein